MKSFLNLEGHYNRISGSKVTVVLLKGLILPIGWVALGRVCACSHRSRLVLGGDESGNIWWKWPHNHCTLFHFSETPLPRFARDSLTRMKTFSPTSLRLTFQVLLSLHFILHTAHCTLYTAHCTLYTEHCTLHCLLPTANHTLPGVELQHWYALQYKKKCNIYCTLHTKHCKTHTAHCTSSTWRTVQRKWPWKKVLQQNRECRRGTVVQFSAV